MKKYTIFYKEKVIQVLGNYIEHGAGGAEIVILDDKDCDFLPSCETLPILPFHPIVEAHYFKEKKKGHERPYKYHR